MDAFPWIQSLPIKGIVRLQPNIEISKRDIYSLSNFSIKDLKQLRRNFKGQTQNHHSKIEIKIKSFYREVGLLPSILS